MDSDIILDTDKVTVVGTLYSQNNHIPCVIGKSKTNDGVQGFTEDDGRSVRMVMNN